MLDVQFDERAVDALFGDVNQAQLPGMAVGIALHGKPVYRKGFGLASVELPLALSSSIRIRIGSISKQFTALAFLRLCEEGRAQLDESPGRYLPELNAITHRVTMRQLLGNISGLRDATDLGVQFNSLEGRRITSADLLSFYCDIDDVSAPPATTYMYNNGAWVIVGAVIERITGRSLEQVLTDSVFAPIGMHSTLLRRWNAPLVPNSASMHVMRENGVYEIREAFGGVDYAGGGSIVSTVDDMLRWMAHMDSPVVGTPATWALLRQPQTLVNGMTTSYGMGLYSRRFRGIDVLQHGGGVFGGNAMLMKVPAAGLDVIVIGNRSDRNSAEYAEKILATCIAKMEPTAAPFAGPFATGVFKSARTGAVIELRQVGTPPGPQGQVAVINGHHFPVAPDDRGVLRPVGFVSVLGFSISRDGDPLRPSALHFDQFGIRDELTAAAKPTSDEADAIVGQYRSHTTRTDATIARVAGGVRMSVQGPFGSAVHQLEAVAEKTWSSRATDPLVAPPWGLLSFDDRGASFGFSTVLNRDLRFRRRE